MPAPIPPESGDGAAVHVVDRLAFLAAAGEVLASSLDYEETLRQVARLAVPGLGDMCVVDVVEDGRVRRVAVEHVVPEKQGLLETLARDFPPTVGSPAPAGRVLASGLSELLEHVDVDTVRSHTAESRHATLIRTIGVRSHIAVPMSVRGRLLGVVNVGITESDRRYTRDDLAIVEEVARRAAMAVDNAALYRSAQREIERRKQVEAELTLSELRYRAILEQSPVSTQILAPDGRTVAVNGAWETLWGLTLDALGDYNVLTDPQLEEKGITPLLRRAFAGESVQLPTIAYAVDATLPGLSTHAGAVRWVSALAYPVRDEVGSVREVVLIHTDVTDARVAQDRLRASESRLMRALGAARMNVWDLDLATGHVECSSNAREFWGAEIRRADDFRRVIHPDDQARVDQAARDAVDGRAPYLVEFRLRGGDGAERWAQSRGQVERDAEGRSVRLLGATIDISDLRRAEDATRMLADAGETLGQSLDVATTLDNLSRVVVPRLADWYAVDLLAEDGTLERVSVHHADPARVDLARSLVRRFPVRRGTPGGVWRVIETGEPDWAADIAPEVLERNAQGPEHLDILRGLQLRSYIRAPLVARNGIIGLITLVHAESGRRYGPADVAVAVDLARRVATAVDNARLFGQLQQEHRRKDEFLATLAHELRNPLAPIRNGLAVLAASPDAATGARMRAIMERQLGQMVRLIDDLLDLSRVTRGAIELRRQRVGVASIVAAALETSRPLLEAAGVECSTHLPAQPIWLDADATRLSQVLTNLLNNAAKFTPRGGSVDVTARHTAEGCAIEVRDTGVGIDPARLEQVFDMFVRGPESAAHGGLGIGLTLGRHLVHLHGGALRAFSDGPGSGSRFVITLPCAQPVAPPGASHDSGPRRAGASRRVLVVDDNLDAAETLATLLRMDGHEVHTAASGTQALELAARVAPELAFLDIGLPDMSGHELAPRMRAACGTAPLRLVALTGWGRDEDRARAREAGFDAHLTKPVEAAAVQAELGWLDGG